MCRVCGESHCKDSPSYLLKDGTHLIKDTIKADSFICEWCLCWQCSRCNMFFKGQTCSARPSQWLENTRFCGRCGGQKKQGVDIKTLLEVLYSNNLSSILLVIELNFQSNVNNISLCMYVKIKLFCDGNIQLKLQKCQIMTQMFYAGGRI